MFLIVNLQKNFHTEFVGMFKIYQHIKFHMPSS